MEKIASDSPKWGQEDFFPTNPDLADILGRTDLNFEMFYVFYFLDPKFLDFPGAPISTIWPGPGLGLGQGGPSGGPASMYRWRRDAALWYYYLCSLMSGLEKVW